MPFLPDHDRVHLFLLLLWIPLQMVVLSYIRGSEIGILQYDLKQYVPNLPNLSYLWKYASRFASKLHAQMKGTFSSINSESKYHDLPPDTPKQIAEIHERNFIFFGAHQGVRSVRPVTMKFKVGQVVRHRKFGHNAVIIGWDEVAKAPETWMVMRYPKLADEIRVRDQPNYRVLLNSKTTGFQTRQVYVAEEDLVALELSQKKTSNSNFFSESVHPVKHFLLTEYFDYFDGERFVPRPWLRRIYPRG